MIKRFLSFAVLAWLLGTTAYATVTLPFTFAPFSVISSSQMNSNFSAIAEAALNRHGDTIDGAVTLNPGVTFGTGGGKISVTATTADSIKTAGGLTVGSGVVALVGLDGRIPALTSTYFAALSLKTTAGYQSLAVNNQSTTYSATTADDVVTATGTFTITLYSCSGNVGKQIEIKKLDTGTTLTIAAAGAETIDGAATLSVTGQYTAYTLVCTTAGAWSVI